MATLLLSDGPPHPEQIKAAVRMRGTTLTALARAAGLHPRAITLAMRQPWPRAEMALADFLGCSPADLFPDRYDANGNPKRGKAVASQCKAP